jgi:hypothetical protein
MQTKDKDFHQFQLRIPLPEYDRLKKVHKQRVIDAIHSKGDFLGISMHEILLEAVKKIGK